MLTKSGSSALVCQDEAVAFDLTHDQQMAPRADLSPIFKK
jgi:hypothetical protein